MVENMTYGTLIDDVIEEEIKVKKDIVKVKLDRGQITLTYTDEFGDSRSWMGCVTFPVLSCSTPISPD